MNSGRRQRPASFRRGLLAGATAAVLCANVALSQPAQSAPESAEPTGPARDEMYLEADLVSRNDKTNVLTASGSVELRTRGRTVRADEIIYDETAGVLHAKGHIELIEADGSVETAEELLLDDKSKAAVATTVTARLGKEIKIAAASAVRPNEDIQELNRAIYTPCPICVDDKKKNPTWTIQADQVVRDKKKQLVYYRNAVFRIFGAPILYLPVFWNADPQAPRKSGLLPPMASVSDRRGVSYEQPYLFVLSPSSDLVLSPQFNSRVHPFLNGRLRKRFYSGTVDARFGYTYDHDFDGSGRGFGANTSRSYVLASGAFQVDPAWRWGFTAERASDRLIFDKYEVRGAFVARGPYISDDRRLISQLYATRQDQHSYVSVAGMTIQGLRPGDNDRTFPVIGPLVEAHWEPKADVAGGRLRLDASAVSLSREQSQFDVKGQRTPGIDSRRLTLAADWRTSYTSTSGIRLEPFAQLRGDIYAFDDLPAGRRARHNSRTLTTIGADTSLPMVRRFNDYTVVLEPVAQVALTAHADPIEIDQTPDGKPVYFNEDSLAFEFDESNLMRTNKFPGFDLFETGARLNVAGRAAVMWDDGRRANLVIGRSFRNRRDNIFAPRSGLQRQGSDWVVAAEAQPLPGLSVFTRARMDSKDLGVHRAEAGANLSGKWGSGYVRYLRDDLDINGAKQENLDLGAEVFFSRNWGISTYGNRDMVQKAWVVQDVGLIYRDDCTRFEIFYRHEDTVIGRLGSANSVGLRLTLATLGDPINGK